MERVARISKLTVDNFEQLLMTVEGLTYEENTPEILSALRILQEQLNKRVLELESSYEVEPLVEEEEYSYDFINALAEEMVKKGSIRFMTQPSAKLMDLVEARVKEIRESQTLSNDEELQHNSLLDEVLGEEVIEDSTSEVTYSEEYIDELAHEMLETGRLSMLQPPDPVLLGLVNARLQELKTQLDELTEKITIPTPQKIDSHIVEELAQQFVKVGSLKFLSNPPKDLVDAINVRAAEIRQAQSTSSLEDNLEEDLKNEEIKETPKFDPAYVDELAQQVIATGKVRFLAQPPEGLLDAVNDRVMEIRAEQKVATNELDDEEKKDHQHFDLAYIDELAQQVIATGGLRFLTEPPEGLLDAVNDRVMEIRKEHQNVLIPEDTNKTEDLKNEEIKDKPQFDPAYVDELAQQVIATGKVNFLAEPPEGLLDAVNDRVMEIRAEQKDAAKMAVEEKKEQPQFDPAYIDELAQQMIDTGRVAFFSKPPEGLMEVVHKRVAEIRAMLNQEEVVEIPTYDPAYVDFLAQEVIRTGKLNFTDIPPEGLMTAINNRVIELRELESQNNSVVTK